ncbi:MAG TPA: hypothetical protein PLH57_03200 [Oligoflexia bacterium]|nr:hypothetical protein [Oligoflexia bacterium]
MSIFLSLVGGASHADASDEVEKITECGEYLAASVNSGSHFGSKADEEYALNIALNSARGLAIRLKALEHLAAIREQRAEWAMDAGRPSFAYVLVDPHGLRAKFLESAQALPQLRDAAAVVLGFYNSDHYRQARDAAKRALSIADNVTSLQDLLDLSTADRALLSEMHRYRALESEALEFIEHAVRIFKMWGVRSLPEIATAPFRRPVESFFQSAVHRIAQRASAVVYRPLNRMDLLEDLVQTNLEGTKIATSGVQLLEGGTDSLEHIVRILDTLEHSNARMHRDEANSLRIWGGAVLNTPEISMLFKQRVRRLMKVFQVNIPANG